MWSLKRVSSYLLISGLAISLSGCDSSTKDSESFIADDSEENSTIVTSSNSYQTTQTNSGEIETSSDSETIEQVSSELSSSSNNPTTESVTPSVGLKIPQIKTLYSGVPNDPIYGYQWHLTMLHTEDIWSQYSGSGVSVSVIDSGVEASHPDLYHNIDFSKSYRYSDSSNDPSPDKNQLSSDPYGNAHGTACAGIIGASGWNEEGVIGVAPTSDIVGFNAFSTGYDADFEDALGRADIDISSNSWGGQLSDMLYDDPASMRGVQNGIQNGRGGKGTIYVFASGNEGNNANYSTLHGSKYVFNIGSVTVDYEVPSYSNHGDNLLLTAPAGDQYGLMRNRGIFTTDLVGETYGFDNDYSSATRVLGDYDGDYTGLMNGTSSAVPVVSGSIALILEANPSLTYRETKYILAKSSTPTNVDDQFYRWEENGAGVLFSPYYGFGVLNLVSAVEMAKDFNHLSEEYIISKNATVQNGEIPDGDETGIESTIEIENSINIEHVKIILDIPNHRSIGDLEITLESPMGTTSQILSTGDMSEGTISNWEFNSLKFLDEVSTGVWRLRIRDLLSRDVGTLNSWSLTISGR
jgi:subtilisin family serine protease